MITAVLDLTLAEGHTSWMRVRCPVVIGWEAELAAIAGLIAGSGAGHGGVLFLLVSRAYASRRCCGLPSPMFNRRIWAGSIQARAEQTDRLTRDGPGCWH